MKRPMTFLCAAVAAAIICGAAASAAYAAQPASVSDKPGTGRLMSYAADTSADAVQCDTNSGIPGDINGDRRVTNADLTRLMKYLAGEDVNVNASRLDINGDGTVDNRDLSRLMKHLADPDVEIF